MQAFMTRVLRSPALATIPVPSPGPNDLLIKVAYVSLNPTDHKHAAVALPPSKVIGCDFSGTVESLGDAVDKNSFSPGDRVAGIIHGSHYSHTGAFAEYLVTDAGVCFRVPDRLSLEQTCTLGVGWISAMQALHQRLYADDKGPKGKDDTLLIYSAATNMGMHALQQARLEHPETCIIALASARHHDMLRKLGATEVFNYASDSVVADVRKLGRDVRRGIDCHSEGGSTVLTARCMLPNDEAESCATEDRRRVIRTLPPSMMKGTVPPSVRADEWILSYTALGKPFRFFFKHFPAVKRDYDAASAYMEKLPELLDDGKVVPVRHRLMTGGLEDIGQGFDEMKAGKVRGEKLVYQVAAEASAR